MDHDDAHTSQCSSLSFPLRGRGGPALLKILAAHGVESGVGGIQENEASAQSLRDDGDVVRVERDVWVAQRMDIPHRAIDRRGHLEQMHERCRLEVARTSGLDLRVAGVLQQHRHPADLEIRARGHDQIGRACPRNETRLRVDAMYVLERAGRRVDVNLVAPQLGDQ